MSVKHTLCAIALALSATPALAADVGVSISIGQPGFYGQIDIGSFPQPRVIYPQPIIIDRGHSYGGPVYLRVPPGHEKHWDKHCYEYRACGRPVYFVHNDWYEREYAPAYRARYGNEDRHGDHYDDDQGHGHGHDKGHGHGHGHGHD